MSNLTGRPVTSKGGKPKRIKSSTHWAAEYGTDEEFQAFVRKLPSALSGQAPCVFAHYRTAANSGIGIKPEFSGIPLTPDEHAEQHRIGTFAFMPRSWWEREVDRHLRLWAQSKA